MKRRTQPLMSRSSKGQESVKRSSAFRPREAIGTRQKRKEKKFVIKILIYAGLGKEKTRGSLKNGTLSRSFWSGSGAKE